MTQDAEDIEKKLKKFKGSFPDKLTYDGLILLLEHDQSLRQLIRNICKEAVGTDQTTRDYVETDTEQQKEQIDTENEGDFHQLPVPPDSAGSLQTELSPALDLLKLVMSNTKLNSLLLGDSGSEGERLMTLLVNLGRWDRIEVIWDALATDVKQREDKATTDELKILEGSLKCFNLANNQYKANLDQPGLLINFNYKVHNRLNAKGKVVTDIALPGLIESSGDVVRKALVITE